MNILCRIFGHNFKEEFISTNSCEHIKVCKRCKYKLDEIYINHILSKSNYIDENSCVVIVSCRCGEVKKREIIECEFGEWVKEDSCTEIRTCKRCKRREVRYHHDMYWSYTSAHHNQLSCRNCNYTEAHDS